ncbi:MAG: alpha/beta fold hydrolase [Candidatus Hodarchaeales archaeon]|jgi:pimeloyl-ACP methyl ester carboxylesterase
MNKFKHHKFPVGIKNVHPDSHMNMHLNWALSVGYINLEDVEKIASLIKTIKDGKKVMLEVAQEAMDEGRLDKAYAFYRFTEFFTSPSDKDKGCNYKKFIELFYSMAGISDVQRIEVPYDDYFLHTLHLKPKSEIKGQIVWFGGGDSVVEDFLSIAYYFMNNGFEIYLFDGPGQGEAIYKYNKPFILEWEKPVKTILDYFELNNVTLIGTSFGGWFVLRAAAFDDRISRIIAFNIIYDYFECFLAKKSRLVKYSFKFLLKIRAGKIINFIIRKQMSKDIMIEWLVNFGSYVNGVDSPYEYFKRMELFNVKNYFPSRITQNVLLLAGENDHFVPPELLEKQRSVLNNARSITTRLFTKEEQADLHCQVGNMQLALDVMLKWIKEKS